MNKTSSLSQSQFLMWMGQHLDPDLPLYNMAFAFKLHGEINRSAFIKAFQLLVNKTDAMRLIIGTKDGSPYQSVNPQMQYEIEFLDLSQKTEPEAALENWLAQRVLITFDLVHCLFDSVLIKLAKNQYVWYLNQHHIIVDIWSSTIIYKRMADLYQCVLSGNENEQRFPDYMDYIEYEHNFRQSSQFRGIEQYWHEKLANPKEITHFFDSATNNKTARTRRVSYSLNQQQLDALNALVVRPDVRGINEDLTKFSLFASVLFLLMYRLDANERKQKTLRIGTPFHNRPTAAFKDTVGLFIEIAVLQVEFDPEETFLSLLKKTQAEGLMGLRYAQPGASSAQMNSAYDVLLNYIHVDYGDFAGVPMRSEWIHSGYGDRHHNCRLQVHDHDQTGGITLHFDLNTDVFSSHQCQWFVQYFVRGLEALAQNPTQLLGDVSLLTGEEWQTQLIEYNANHKDYPENQTVISLFEAQVKETPDAVALVLNEQVLTYQELDLRANQLANKLQGVRLAGLFLERSIEAVVGIFGILKAGGAYVPIDSATPAARVAYIIADAQISILLTQQKYVGLVCDTGCEILCMDTDWSTADTLPRQTFKPEVMPDSLAYVIYTSGSTGQPKGVMIPHRGLVHYLQWAKSFYLEGKRLDFPLYSSLAFDLTITSLFIPLISGGRLIIYPEEHGSSSAVQGLEILTVIEENVVDIIKLTPAHLNLLTELSIESTRIKKIIVGGEDFKTDLAEEIHHHFSSQNGGQQLIQFNEYGPTETVVGCMIHQYDLDHDKLISVPIGRPIDNTQIYILDKRLEPVPTGVSGEIYIAGGGVGYGYLNQPDLTKKSFLENPFTPDSTIYRSGDQARWNDKGQIEFLGRIDNQVKLRGYRIELGEIERTLLKHPLIQEAVVDVVNRTHLQWPDQIEHCEKCGLPSNYPEVKFDEEGICNTCREFEASREQVESYFRTRADLQNILDHAKATKTGKHDCLVLLSGGKDSTYMLCQLVEAGVTPLVFSLDNGYISESAKANVERITHSLGLDHIWGRTPDMNAIFRDSLKRFSNVCHGCFKTIYTLSINLANERGIKYILTGLSRGQLFETRLSDTLNAGLFNATEIDQVVIEARKIYHRLDDVVSRCLDTRLFKSDAVFEDIKFVDFYRYTDVEFDELYAYLTEKTSWERPEDTGRSTNCLINELGIYVHKKEQGYHNYALPYSWDVRIGHKLRAEALHELDDDIDRVTVGQRLKEIGYADPGSLQVEKALAAFYVPKQPLDTAELDGYLKKTLPEYMLPKQFYAMEEIPLTSSGKIDRKALAREAADQISCKTGYVEPNTPKTYLLADIWASILRIKRVGLHDNFFDLGGDSISSIQIIVKAKQKGLQLQPSHIFEYQTIAELAKVVKLAPNFEAQQEELKGSRLKSNEAEDSNYPLSGLDSDSLSELAGILGQLEEKK